MRSLSQLRALPDAKDYIDLSDREKMREELLSKEDFCLHFVLQSY